MDEPSGTPESRNLEAFCQNCQERYSGQHWSLGGVPQWGDNHSLDVEIRHLMAEAFENCTISSSIPSKSMREHMM